MHPQATVSRVGTYMLPAKAPDCVMPVLDTPPITSYRDVAIVDAWGYEATPNAPMLALIKRKACEVGADAVVITANSSQHEGGPLLGYSRMAGAYAGGASSGANVSARKHAPGVGEQGHGGHYISGTAIVYTNRHTSLHNGSNAGPKPAP